MTCRRPDIPSREAAVKYVFAASRSKFWSLSCSANSS